MINLSMKSLSLGSYLFLSFLFFVNVSPARSYEDPELIYRTISEKVCKRCDLSHADLAYANLGSAVLTSSDLRYADLQHADLSNADLSGVDLTGANLFGALLRNSNLIGAILSNANLKEADFTGANISSETLLTVDWYDSYGIDLLSMPVNTLYLLSKKYIASNEYKNAEYVLSSILEQNPSDPEVLIARALNRFKLSRMDLAMNDLDQATLLYEQAGDRDSIATIESFRAKMNLARSQESPQMSGNGYGSAVLSSLSGLLPTLIPLARKFIFPSFF